MRWLKTKKKLKFRGKHIILLTAIALVNFLGITYGAWDENVNIASSVSTGTIDPVFNDCVSFDTLQGIGNLRIQFDDEHTMNVQGEVYKDYQGVLKYNLKNAGTVPAKFVKHQQQVSADSLLINKNQEQGIMEPTQFSFNELGSETLEIQAPTEGVYTFEIELLFSQWNK